MRRCDWADSAKDEIYTVYHDSEWCVPKHDDRALFELFVLESFHCGLSWLLILRKRENFRAAFDNFEPEIIRDYDERKIESLLNDAGIVRNNLKIRATISNAAAFIAVQEEYGRFSDYIWGFTGGEVITKEGDAFEDRNELSDRVAKDLKKRGFKFMGSVTTYSYLEAIGVMNNHASYCFKHQKRG